MIPENFVELGASSFVSHALAQFAEEDIRYCLLRGFESLPETYEGSDIDVLVHREDEAKLAGVLPRLGMVLRKSKKENNWYACRYFSQEAKWIVFHPQTKNNLLTSAVAELVLRESISNVHRFKIPRPGHKIGLLVIRAVVQLGHFRERHLQEIAADLAGVPPAEIVSQLNELWSTLQFGAAESAALVREIQARDLPALLNRKDDLVRHLGGLVSLKNTRKPPVLRRLRARTRRLLAGFGLASRAPRPLITIAVTGVDGAGKSTIIDLLAARFPAKLPLFIQSMKAKTPMTKAGQWGVRLRHKRGRGRRILFWVGLVLDVYDKRFRALRIGRDAGFDGGIVIYDRWVSDTVVFHEILGQTRRARVLDYLQERWVPKPDAYIYLSLSPEQARLRKQEDPLPHLIKREQSYRKIYLERGAVIVSADDTIENVYQNTCATILQLAWNRQQGGVQNEEAS